MGGFRYLGRLKIPCRYKKGLLRSQLLTDINFHFIITVKLATSQVLLIYPNPLLLFELHSHPPYTCKSKRCHNHGCPIRKFSNSVPFTDNLLSLGHHHTPLKTAVNSSWESIFRPPKPSHTTNYSLRPRFSGSWPWHICLSTDSRTIYCMLLQSLPPQKSSINVRVAV